MVVRVHHGAEAGRAAVLARRELRDAELSPRMREGVRRVFGADLTADEVVQRILADVRTDGDAALIRYTEQIDGVRLDAVEVSRSELQAAHEAVAPEVIAALETAAARIRRFHERQHIDPWIDVQPEGVLGQLVVPLERVGVYAPGGTAPYPSSLLMTAIPATVAGVGEVVVCAPPERDGQIGRASCRERV